MAKSKKTDERLFEISDGIIAIDLFLYIPKHNVFIISDIHVGYEESLNKQGILIPRSNYDDLVLRIEKAINCILKNYNLEKIDKIVINGDLLHEFSKINIHVKDKLKKFVKFISTYAEPVILEGNHDKVLKFILSDVKINHNIIFDDILITHGDKIISESEEDYKKIKTVIIGHEHPAVSLKSGYRSEKFKCFLKGKYASGNFVSALSLKNHSKELIVMPSCNILIEGTDVLLDRLLSPYLKNNKHLPDFEAFIVEDKIYDFGKLRKLIVD
ncbi:MAG TPA: metallophosphoesterase [Alphaproteobacteria bacterium]|nr:metallophosphoesterase [Alphaproteobacteria bacterium]